MPVGTDLMCIPVTRAQPGHGADVHGLAARARATPPGTSTWNGYPQPCEGGKQAFAKLVKDEPVDRRQPRGARRRRAWSTGSTIPTTAAGYWTPDLDEVKATLSADAASGTGSCSRAASGSSLLFAVPLCLVLALSFGYIDDLGRGRLPFELDNYADAFDSIYIPVLLRSVALRADHGGPLPADRLPGRLLHRPLRRPLPQRR